MQKIILVVEDMDDVRQMMKLLLELSGYAVLEAVNGLMAVESAAELHPDLILMDISMPVMDGLTATRAIRLLKANSTIPIIALTAFGKQFHNQAIEAGCNDLMTKPVDFDTLQPIIERYLV